MKKTVKVNGSITTVDFTYAVNSKVVITEKPNVGDLVSIVGYDYVINGEVFKVVATTTATKPTKNMLYFGQVGMNTVLTVPELLRESFKDNKKSVIEAILSLNK
jgi:hypothetical protein